ncbi:hypothetical protein LWX53_06800, partial [bacterium]|nr:hypothetical protein [bacterium]
MPERQHSSFLAGQKPLLEELIKILAPRFDYISVLGTDDRGLSYAATPGETRTGEPMWVQRGFVFRAQKDGKIAEYACPALGSAEAAGAAAPGRAAEIRAFADKVAAELDLLLAAEDAIVFPPIPDEPLIAEYRGSVVEDPFTADPEAILSRLTALRERLTDGKTVVMAHSRCDCVDVSRIFVSPNRSLFQSFAWSQAYIFGVARKGQVSKMSYRPVSGRKGLELLAELESKLPELAAELASLLDAIKIEPGEYEVILDPD